MPAGKRKKKPTASRSSRPSGRSYGAPPLKAVKTGIRFSGYSGPGIEVSFGKPWRLVLWEKFQYIPCWDLGGEAWMFNEWMETNSAYDRHCYEPMMDLENRYIRARIIEKGPARTIVHWHYADCNQLGQVFHGNTTADEYYVTYPDGTTIRRLVGWPGNESDFGGNPMFWEVGEWDILNAKGVSPDEVIANPFLSLHNLAGDTVDITWPFENKGMLYLCEKEPGIAGIHWSAQYARQAQGLHHPSA
jgi:hypothetical protein